MHWAAQDISSPICVPWGGSVDPRRPLLCPNNKGVQFVIMVGEDEMESGILSIKNMESGEQNNLNITDLIKKLS